MQLIYSGQIFRYVAQPDVLAHRFSAVNWRYRLHNQTDYPPINPIKNKREAHALNWRFQMVLAS
jgi:hypothetical protein